MYRGTVKKFDATKGYGYIDWDGQEIFVHRSAIKGVVGFPALVPGQVVQFDVTEHSGRQAINVVPVPIIGHIIATQ